MTMSIRKAANLALMFVLADIPAMIHGAPGVGKSDMVRMIGKAAGLPVLDIRATLLDPVDLRGVPTVEQGVTVWNPPAFLPDVRLHGAAGILYLDELPNAPTSVQSALLQLVLDRKLGEYELPAGWRIVASGNRQSDRAGAGRMISSLLNRFAHLEIETEGAEFVESWIQWALGAAEQELRADCAAFVPASGIPAEVIAFHQWAAKQGETDSKFRVLHNAEKAEELRAFPSPRSWSQACKMLSAPSDLLSDCMSALIGVAATSAFMGFRSMWQELPKLPEIVAAPDSCRVPHDPSLKYALAAGLSRAMTHGNMTALVRYLSRVSPEFQTWAIMEATKRDATLKISPAYVHWSVSVAGLVA